ncbi:MAG: glycosyltransferase family 39 protein [bacterium]|nr:glycosyltransferase family 39 protein [bacterium]
MSARREGMLLVGVCLMLYLTGVGEVPFYTRGEPREGMVVQEMQRTGEWLVPARPDGDLARKPPLYYWLGAVALAVLPERAELALRLPSAIAATAGVAATWTAARAAFGPAAALPAAAVLATSFEWVRAATSARVDMVLGGALAITFAGFTLALVRRGRGPLVLATAGAALAALAKGPVGLALPALAIGALMAVRRDRSLLAWLRPIHVLGVAGAVAALWYGAALMKYGAAFFEVVAKENWLRFIDTDDAKTGHAHGILYLPLLGLVGLLPWTPLLPLAAVPPRRGDTPAARAAAFALAWAVVTLVFFSLADAKRSVYLLPAFPAFALLVGAALAGPPPTGRVATALRFTTALYAPVLLVLAAAVVALAAGVDVVAPFRPWLDPRDAIGADVVEDAISAVGSLLGPLAIAAGIASVFLARAARAADWRRVVTILAVLALGWTMAFDAFVHPPVARTRSLAAFMRQIDRRVPPAATLHAFYKPDPGMRFYAPRPVQRWGEATDDPSYLLLWEDEWQRWRDRAGRPLRPLLVSDARDASRGSLALFVVRPKGLVPAPEPSERVVDPGEDGHTLRPLPDVDEGDDLRRDDAAEP